MRDSQSSAWCRCFGRDDLMQLRYEDAFVEGAVFGRANLRRNGPPSLQIRRFHAAREKLYSILDSDERNAAFFRLHLEWFREWGLERQLIEVADEFPRLRTALSALVFRTARGRNDEGAELYVNTVTQAFSRHGGTGSGDFPVARLSAGLESPVNQQARKPALQTAVVALRVQRLDDANDLTCFLRHEFTHVDDMVNPEFGYSPQLALTGQNVAQQRVAGERYRLLWDITIDGRLAAAGRATTENRQRHREMFDRAFSFWTNDKREIVFSMLWQNKDSRHAELLAIASDPRDLRAAQAPVPGGQCPLCGFATFDWADAAQLEERTTEAILQEFPNWTIDQGVCGRCVQIYRVVGGRLAAVL